MNLDKIISILPTQCFLRQAAAYFIKKASCKIPICIWCMRDIMIKFGDSKFKIATLSLQYDFVVVGGGGVPLSQF